jgi:AraC family transcriptional regulator
VRPEDYVNNVRPDGTATYLDLNPVTPTLSSRGRGWEGLVVERDHFSPFDNGEVVYEEHLLGFILDDDVHLSYAVEGRRCEGRYRSDDYFLCPGQQPVHWRLDDPSHALVVMIRPEVIWRAAQEMTDVDPSRVLLLEQPRLRDPLLKQIGLTLMAELEGPAVGERLYVDSLLNTLTLHLIRHYSSLSHHPELPKDRGLPKSKLRRAIDAMQDRLEAGISISELAETAGVSVSHFETLFKRSTGLSPHQYLIRCRVERAKELLRRGDLSLAQVAARSGFCDQGHFGRHFKRSVGVTPSRYRKES